MDDLRELVSIIRDLPAFGLAILAGYLLYRLAVIGSIYGVIRLAICKLYDWKTAPPPPPPPKTFDLKGLTINEAVAVGLAAQLTRLASSGGYLHAEAVVKLREALDAKLGTTSK